MYYYTIQFYNQIAEVMLLAFGVLCLSKLKKNKLLFLLLSISINAVICYWISSYKLRDLTIVVFMNVVNCLLLKILKKDFSLKDIFISLYVYFIHLICTYSTIQFFSSVLNLSPMKVILQPDIYVLINMALLSKLLFVVVIIVSLRMKIETLLDEFDRNEWYAIIGVTSVITFISFHLIKFMFQSNYSPISILEYFKSAFLFILVGFGFVFLMKKYKNYYERKLIERSELEKYKLQKNYKDENLKNLKRIKMDIENKEHRMNYILQSVEYDLLNHDYEEATNKIQIVKELIAKIEPVVFSENDMFDFMINMEIKQLYLYHKTIKIAAFISKNEAYNQYHIWNTIIEVMRQVAELHDYFEIFIIEKNENMVEIKFIINNVTNESILKEKIVSLKDSIKIKHIDHILTLTYSEQLNEA